MRKPLILLLLLLLPIFSLMIPSTRGVFGAENIVFEYGAESGMIEPPWDIVGAYPGSSEGRGDVEISSTHVRSGTKAVRFWQEDGGTVPKNDADRRIELREYSSISQKELYVSWWVYFDTFNNRDGDDDRATLGGVQTFYGPSGDRWRWWTACRFAVHSGPSHYVQIAYGLGSSRGGWSGEDFPTDAINDAVSSSDYIYVGGNPVSLLDYLDQWIHFQIHMKWTTTATGVVEAWFNNNLVYSQTNFINDPSGYSQWDAYNNLWGYSTAYPIPTIEYYSSKESINQELWVDDVVVATEKVTEAYGVSHTDVEFERFEDGFNDGTLDAWNDTQLVGGKITVVSSPVHSGGYSAKFNVSGDANKVVRLIQYVQPVEYVTIRSYVRFAQLPVGGSVLEVLRIGNATGDWIGRAAIRTSVGSDYYWRIIGIGGEDETLDNSISTNQWYSLELTVNATSSGHLRLYVNNTLTCEDTGDYSSNGEVAYAYPQLYDGTGQGSETIVYHDTVVIDQEHIGLGTPRIFQVGTYCVAGGDTSPLENVKINGSHLTDASGSYQWTNLGYNTRYAFVVECPSSYYPAWIVNVDGSFSWNSTHFTLLHNVTEGASGYIKINFQTFEHPYVSSATDTLTSVSSGYLEAPSEASLSFSVNASSGTTSSTVIHTQGNGKPTSVEGTPTWTYDPVTDLLSIDVMHSSLETVEVDWQEVVVTPEPDEDFIISGGSSSVGEPEIPEVVMDEDALPLVGLVAVGCALAVITGTGLYKSSVQKGKRQLRGVRPREPKRRKPYRPRDF